MKDNAAVDVFAAQLETVLAQNSYQLVLLMAILVLVCIILWKNL